MGVIGTGKIVQTVIRNLSVFGFKMLAYDLYPNDAVKKYADYVTLDELYARSDAVEASWRFFDPVLRYWKEHTAAPLYLSLIHICSCR